jgi:NitT/TauT family transport system substrate-binding protein
LRPFGTWLICALLLAPLTTGSAAADPPAMVPVNIVNGLAGEAVEVYIAKNEGIFAKHHIDATLTSSGSPQVVMTGLFAGQTQIAMSNPVQLLTAVNGGLDFVVVAGGTRVTAAKDPAGLDLRADVPYNSPADLKGLSIGVPGFNSAAFMAFKAWLQQRHVDPGQVHFVEVQMSAENDLLASHKLDGVLAIDPFLTEIAKNGTGKLISHFMHDLAPNRPSIFWISTRAWAQSNPQVVAAFRESLVEAAQFIAANQDKTRALEVSVFGSADPNLGFFTAGVEPRDLDTFYVMGKQQGVFTKNIDTKSLILK